jgi:hypothetical protein
VIRRLLGRISDNKGVMESGLPSAPPSTVPPTPRRAQGSVKPVGTCSRPGCTATKGWRCSYVDPKGKRCGWWCKEHLIFVQGQPWCHRHANTIRELRKRSGSIYEINRMAAIEDRSPSLASLIVEEVNQDVNSTLARHYAGIPGVTLVTDPAIREVQIAKTSVIEGADGLTVLRQGSERAWQRGWGVYSNSGYLARVSIRVTVSEPPVAQVLVNSRLILSTVPDFISARAAGQDDAGARAAFRARVVAAIVGALANPREDDLQIVNQ